jgi:hypothetical protein
MQFVIYNIDKNASLVFAQRSELDGPLEQWWPKYSRAQRHPLWSWPYPSSALRSPCSSSPFPCHRNPQRWRKPWLPSSPLPGASCSYFILPPHLLLHLFVLGSLPATADALAPCLLLSPLTATPRPLCPPPKKEVLPLPPSSPSSRPSSVSRFTIHKMLLSLTPSLSPTNPIISPQL